MLNVDDYILGNELLHKRLCVTAEILGELVMHAPRSVSIERLAHYTGHPVKELTKLCRNLWRAELLQPDPVEDSNWMLACDPGAVTLEDVFRCLIARQPRCNKRDSGLLDTDRPQRDISLLLMQATMGINQSVYNHLRQFSLDRLKISTNSMLSSVNQSPCRPRELPDAAASD